MAEKEKEKKMSKKVKKYSLEDLQLMVKELKEELASLDTEEVRKEITEEGHEFLSPDEIIGMLKEAYRVEIKQLEELIEEYRRVISQKKKEKKEMAKTEEKEFLLSEIRKWREEMKQGKDVFDDYNDKADFYIKIKLNLLDQITAQILTDEQKKELKEMLKNILPSILLMEDYSEENIKQAKDKLIPVLDKIEEYLTEK